ncbi:contractile injection system tape measure protein [Dickeya lacustris]|uniref:Contractile injection system tape measure protein n=1 Tax=Dickeya lacustris TaxID=2259638 RepID=A0ABY8G4R0_9GAMM|nr:contractile injection system tape measure protein [Dickeya lacustris]WFN54930.1 contractile injection system tape measure protein [Dickeya lacustris]
MTQPHRIDTAILTFDVDTPALATQLEQQAPRWVKHVLLEHMDTLFGRFSPPHQHWVIDQLTLDLGVLPADDIAQQATPALERQLVALFAASPAAMTDATPTDAPGTPPPLTKQDAAPPITVWDDAQASWQQLHFFLQRGVMPWHYPSRVGWYQGEDGRHWLAEAVRLHHTRLMQLLRTSAQPHALLARLVSQLPANALSRWLARLDPTYQTIALHSLAIRRDTAALPAALRLQLHHHWHQRIHQALMQRRLHQELLPLWPELIGPQRQRFQLALYACSQQPEIIRAIAQALDDAYFDDVLLLLAPQAHPFLRDVIRQPHWFTPAETPPAPETLAGARHHLHEFTLHYLLVQRGSQFNKRRYLAGLVARMAAHYNLAHTAMLDSLHQHLTLWQGDSALRQQLLSLLALLRDTLAPPAQRVPPSQAYPAQPVAGERHHDEPDEPARTASRWLWWQQALQHGDEETVNLIWQRCHSEDLPLLSHLLFSCAQAERVRQHWIAHFGIPTRERLLNLLEPAAAPFIHLVLTEVQASAPPPTGEGLNTPQLTESLWHLTLNYLLAARGSEFNRRAYLDMLLRQVAAHHNLSYPRLLEALQHALQRPPVNTALHQSLLALLAALACEPPASSPVQLASPPPEPDNTGADDTGQYAGDAAPQSHELHESHESHDATPADAATAPDLPVWRSEEDIAPSPLPPLDSACYQYLQHVLRHANPTRRFQPPQEAYAHWSQHRHGEPDDVLRCLGYLQAYNPLLIQRLQATSACYPARWQRLCAALRPSQAVRIVMLLLQLRQPALRHHPITRALDYATRALSPTQRQAFYGEVMAQLAANQLPDWQAIRRAVSLSPAPRVTAPPPPNPTPKPAARVSPRASQRLTPDQARDCLTRFCADAAPRLTGEVIAALRTLLAHDIEALCRLLLPCLRSASNARQLAARLPESLHTALLSHRCRDDFMALYPYARLITNLCLHHPLYRAKPQTLESLFWYGLYQALPTTGARVDIAPFIRRYLALLGADWQQRSHSDAPEPLYRFLLEQAATHVLPATHRLTERLRACLQPPYLPQPEARPDRHDGAPGKTAAAQTPAHDATPTSLPLPVSAAVPDWGGDEPLGPDDPIVVTNAGLVLFAPYLPRLFTTLRLVQQGEFCGESARYQAIACLHSLVDAGPMGAEYQLALNKLLCGMPLNAALPATAAPDSDSRNTLVSLLDAVRQHWKALGQTSSLGLQQTFLQREGHLWRQADSWRLEVLAGPFDMLLDHLPWSFSPIKYPWMAHPLQVVWR